MLYQDTQIISWSFEIPASKTSALTPKKQWSLMEFVCVFAKWNFKIWIWKKKSVFAETMPHLLRIIQQSTSEVHKDTNDVFFLFFFWKEEPELYYQYAVSFPDRSPHGERGRWYTTDTVQQRQTGTRTHCTGHLTGKYWEAAQGKAACTHTRTRTV